MVTVGATSIINCQEYIKSTIVLCHDVSSIKSINKIKLWGFVALFYFFETNNIHIMKKNLFSSHPPCLVNKRMIYCDPNTDWYLPNKKKINKK